MILGRKEKLLFKNYRIQHLILEVNPMPTQKPRWEERWDKAHLSMVGLAVEKIEKDFIRKEIELAKKEERGRIAELLREKADAWLRRFKSQPAGRNEEYLSFSTLFNLTVKQIEEQ